MSPVEEKPIYDFLLAGIPLRLRSSQPEEVVMQIIGEVEQRLHQTQTVTKSGSLPKAAILVALNLAEELMMFKQELRMLKSELQREVALLEQQQHQWKSEFEHFKTHGSFANSDN